jgi:uncharacterized protein YecE (DUF72 family)
MKSCGDTIAAFCIHDFADMRVPHEITAGLLATFAFMADQCEILRWYSDDQLAHGRRRIKEWRKRLSDIYVYFNNDPEGAAVQNALTLKRMVH